MMPFFFGPRQITAEEVVGRRKPMLINERLEVTGRGRIPAEVEWSRCPERPNMSGKDGPQMSMSIKPVCFARLMGSASSSLARP